MNSLRMDWMDGWMDKRMNGQKKQTTKRRYRKHYTLLDYTSILQAD